MTTFELLITDFFVHYSNFIAFRHNIITRMFVRRNMGSLLGSQRKHLHSSMACIPDNVQRKEYMAHAYDMHAV